MKFNKYILEIVVFVCGAVVMIFELVGSRVLGPYLGTSIFVWTSLIGVILGSLSLGYYWGGKIADKKPNFESLSAIIFISAILIGLTTLTKDYWLIGLQGVFSDAKITSVFVSIILFAPVSICLGMISPYAVKLKMHNLDTSASTVGNLYAISTLGSIFGTFLSGFYLIPYFGTNKLLIIKQFVKTKLFFLLIIVIGCSVMNIFNSVILKDVKFTNFIDVDTAYNRIWVYDHIDKGTGELVKTMGINNENHSSMFLNSDELVNEYTKYYNLAEHFNPSFQKTLMFGGAGYSYPKYFLERYKDATIDVVEIDPKVTELAKEYFRLKDDPRLTIYHEDGRVYLNKTKEKYDVIYGDAFTSHYSLPYQLTTKEAIQEEYNVLNDNGLVVLNIISALEGGKSDFLKAEYITYKNIFPQVYLFPVTRPDNGGQVQNVILVALRSEKSPSFTDVDSTLNEYLGHLWQKPIETNLPILTDDFAPVDYYINKTI
jgi:spermidine synthase